MLDKQVKIYDITEKYLYTDDENKIERNISIIRKEQKFAKEYVAYKKLKEKECKTTIKAKTEEVKKYLSYQLEKYLKIMKVVTEEKDESKKQKILKNIYEQYEKQKKYFDSIHISEKTMAAIRKAIHKIICESNFEKSIVENEMEPIKFYDAYNDKYIDTTIAERYTYLDESKKKLSKELKEEILKHDNTPRVLGKKLNVYNQIAIFKSDLTDAFKLKQDELTDQILIFEVTSHAVMQQLIDNGFDWNNNKHYQYYASGAGQIRKKKLFIVQKDAYKKVENRLTAGLIDDDINALGGMNNNKCLAYKALVCSSSDPWENFNIDESIVIPDWNYILQKQKVYHIEKKQVDKGYVLLPPVEKEMDIPITVNDGCGLILPALSTKCFQFRMPWFKGLLCPMDFIKWCDENNNGNYKIIDLWGKEWNLKMDNIKIIFSESQFKAHKYFKDWNEYKNSFRKFGCDARVCKIEANDFNNKSIDYQMLQTLRDMKDEEIHVFADKINKKIEKAHTNYDYMLNSLGAGKDNDKKTYLQQCIAYYPELLNTKYVRKKLKDAIASMRKDAKCGKFKVDSFQTYVLPDVYAWMNHIFKNKDDGILDKDHVSCKLAKNEEELLLERSPHLYQEHPVRKNLLSKQTKKWFITNGIYTSIDDIISKFLMFDNDGDELLCIKDKTLIKVAKRNMKDIIPLYYEMGKAAAQIINNENIYNNLVYAFKSGNIGKYSNLLTKLWNDNEDSFDLELAAIITALNNFSIDSAKTLEMPGVQKDVKEKINKLKTQKLPYFMQFAKTDYAEDKFAERNDSTVNRLCKMIEDKEEKKIKFEDISFLPAFRTRRLLNNIKIEIDDDAIKKWKEINKNKNKILTQAKADKKEKDEIINVWTEARKEFTDYCKDNNINLLDATDMVIKYTFKKQNDTSINMLFNCFGDQVLKNLHKNIEYDITTGDYYICQKCGKRFKKKKTEKNVKYCEKCREVKNLEVA